MKLRMRKSILERNRRAGQIFEEKQLYLKLNWETLERQRTEVHYWSKELYELEKLMWEGEEAASQIAKIFRSSKVQVLLITEKKIPNQVIDYYKKNFELQNF